MQAIHIDIYMPTRMWCYDTWKESLWYPLLDAINSFGLWQRTCLLRKYESICLCLVPNLLPLFSNSMAILSSRDNLCIIRFGITWGIKWRLDFLIGWDMAFYLVLSKDVIEKIWFWRLLLKAGFINCANILTGFLWWVKWLLNFLDSFLRVIDCTMAV